MLPLVETAHAGKATAAVAKKKQTDPGPVLAVVSLAQQRISVYGRAGLMAQSSVSTGMAGHRTPTGVFSIVQKNKFHRSNIYWNAPMPYMQRLTWSGVSLHAGVVPGYPASHGCIRLPHQFAVGFWRMSKIGTRVIVVPNDASVLSVEAPQLPVPRLAPAAPEETRHSEHVGTEMKTLVGLTSMVRTADAAAATSPPAARLLSPLERATSIRAVTATDALATAKSAKAAGGASALQAAAARSAVAARRASAAALATARSRREAAAKKIERATTPQMTVRAQQALATAEARLAEAEQADEAARAVEAAETAEAMAAANAAANAERASREATAALKAAERAIEPISILVSKKAGKIYIRQSWVPVYEAPVTFKDTGVAIGTHVYLAVAPEANEAALRWLAVSPAASAAPRKAAKERLALSAAAQRSNLARETAASALERFELPEEAQRFIADRLWTGASLIVSDEGISNETGTFTDFIVLTR
jgi:hypothetical protein